MKQQSSYVMERAMLKDEERIAQVVRQVLQEHGGPPINTKESIDFVILVCKLLADQLVD